MMKIATIAASAVAAAVLFTGCMTTTLQTNAKMTQSIFLDPVAKNKRIIFVNVKNTSGHDVNLEQKILRGLQSKGYTISDDPEAATYVLSTNILYCDRKQENNAAGAAAVGGTTGALVGIYNRPSATAGVVGGLAGAAVGGIVGKLTEDTIWQMQVDINIRQKAKGKVATQTGQISGQATVRDNRASGFLNSFGGPVRRDGTGELQTNQTNTSSQAYETDYIEKSTIIFAEAVKMGLQLPEATPILEDKIAQQIVGLF